MIPLAVVLTSLFNLGLNLVVVLVFLLAFGVAPMWTWLLASRCSSLALIVLTTAVSMIVSSLYPRFRDLAIIWTVPRRSCSTRARCCTRSTRSPSTLRDIFMLNPLAPLLELFRKWVVDPTAPGPVDLAGGGSGCCPRRRSSWRPASRRCWLFEREAPRIAEEL